MEKEDCFKCIILRKICWNVFTQTMFFLLYYTILLILTGYAVYLIVQGYLLADILQVFGMILLGIIKPPTIQNNNNIHEDIKIMKETLNDLKNSME